MIAVVAAMLLVAFLPGVGEAFRGVILGAIVAGSVSIGAQWLKGEQDARLDSMKRADDRQIESDRLQRDTLLELQERLTEWMREVALLDHQDAKIVDAVGHITQSGAGASEGEFTIGRRMMYLTERVKDDDLRNRLRALRKAHTDSEMYRIANHDTITVGWLEADMLARMRQFNEDSEALGSVLRRYL